MADSDNNGHWLTIAEAARQLGISRQAIQNRIRRGKIENQLDNRGNPIVRVAATAPNPVSGATGATVAATGATQPQTNQPAPDPTNHPPTVAEIDRLRADLLAERQRHEAEIARLIGQVGIERSLWLERLDAAECRAERVEARLDQVLDQLMERNAPWWERLIRLFR